MSTVFRILYQDPHYVAIDKPAGFHVHPPEDKAHRISKSVNCLALLRDQLGTYLYPVHRLDRATSGVLIFGLSSEAAKKLSESFTRQEVQKTYYCVTRGWILEKNRISRPLKSEQSSEEPSYLDSITDINPLARIELPIAVGPYSSCRYSLVEVQPKTGRRHQIRRHLEHISHPLVGDTVYGRTEHNRIFKEHLGISGLLLKAYSLEFIHPFYNHSIRIISKWNGAWHRVFNLFGVCPYPTQNSS